MYRFMLQAFVFTSHMLSFKNNYNITNGLKISFSYCKRAQIFYLKKKVINRHIFGE